MIVFPALFALESFRFFHSSMLKKKLQTKKGVRAFSAGRYKRKVHRIAQRFESLLYVVASEVERFSRAADDYWKRIRK